MRFWDSSAIVQCYLEQGLQKFVRRLYLEDEDVVIALHLFPKSLFYRFK